MGTSGNQDDPRWQVCSHGEVRKDTYLFGYITPEKPELKIKEYETYRAYYCGICKSIKDRHGNIPRLSLTYDSAFLALLLSSISDEGIEIKVENCIAHPIKKRKIARNSRILNYVADINIILAYLNLADKWKDDRSTISLAGMAALKGSYKKLNKQYPEKSEVILSRLRELAALEDERCPSMDQAAEPFAKLMEEVFTYEPLCRDEAVCQIFKWIGYNLGKWIYMIDAFHDLEDDIRKKSYNPLIHQYNYNNDDITEFKLRLKKDVEFNLIYSLNQMAKAYQHLDVKHDSGIVENIIYMGMLRKTETVLGCGGKCVEKSV
jgi:hypothetical protein